MKMKQRKKIEKIKKNKRKKIKKKKIKEIKKINYSKKEYTRYNFWRGVGLRQDRNKFIRRAQKVTRGPFRNWEKEKEMTKKEEL